MSRDKEAAEGRIKEWNKRKRQLAQNPIPTSDEKSKYYNLKYDVERGVRLDEYKLKYYEELKKKYG